MQQDVETVRDRIITLVFLILFVGYYFPCFSQPHDYREIFGSDWIKASQFADENQYWMQAQLKKHNIPYSSAMAVVFPELVRYSAIRDKLETTMLKTLYRNLGNDYSDFSIGVFQIKPSFAEKIRDGVHTLDGRIMRGLFPERTSYKNDREYRDAIVSELEDPVKAFNYIIAFLKICDKQFPDDEADPGARIRLLSTAYNTGFWKRREEIEEMSNLAFFNTNLFNTENYCYADVSLYWYNQYLQKGEN